MKCRDVYTIDKVYFCVLLIFFHNMKCILDNLLCSPDIFLCVQY